MDEAGIFADALGLLDSTRFWVGLTSLGAATGATGAGALGVGAAATGLGAAVGAALGSGVSTFGVGDGTAFLAIGAETGALDAGTGAVGLEGAGFRAGAGCGAGATGLVDEASTLAAGAGTTTFLTTGAGTGTFGAGVVGLVGAGFAIDAGCGMWDLGFKTGVEIGLAGETLEVFFPEELGFFCFISYASRRGREHNHRLLIWPRFPGSATPNTGKPAQKMNFLNLI